MLRHRRLREVECADELAHGPLTVAEQIEDPTPVRLGEHFEDVHDCILPAGYMRVKG